MPLYKLLDLNYERRTVPSSVYIRAAVVCRHSPTLHQYWGKLRCVVHYKLFIADRILICYCEQPDFPELSDDAGVRQLPAVAVLCCSVWRQFFCPSYTKLMLKSHILWQPAGDNLRGDQWWAGTQCATDSSPATELWQLQSWELLLRVLCSGNYFLLQSSL